MHNELDSLIALGILRLAAQPAWRVSIASPARRVTSMNGVAVEAQATLADAATADAVIVGSGLATRSIVDDPATMDALRFDPARQLVGAQCSGALVLARLGLLGDVPACTDLTTRPWVQAAGVRVLEQPFFAQGNVATAGGCLGAQYLAFWMAARLGGIGAAERALPLRRARRRKGRVHHAGAAECGAVPAAPSAHAGLGMSRHRERLAFIMLDVLASNIKSAMRGIPMRTTLDIADDVLFAAKELARREKKPLGQVISELARRAFTQPAGTANAPTLPRLAEPLAAYGIHPLPPRGAVISNELIDRLRDEEGI